MKITDSQVIRDGEKELINAVKDEIDPEKIRELIAHKLSTGNLKAKDGQIVIHNNQIAFRLDFEMQFTGSILLDREGNLLSDEVEELQTPMDQESLEDDDVLISDDLLDQEPGVLDSDDEDSEEEPGTEDDPILPEQDIDTEFPEETLSDSDDEGEVLSEDDHGEEELSDDEILELTEEEPMEEETLDSDLEDLEEDDLEDEELENAEEEELDSDLEELENDDDDSQSIAHDMLTDEKKATDSQEDIIDENINEILEESRAFWKQNKKD